MLELDGIIRRAPALVVRLALAHTKTAEGARRIYYAEAHGLCRSEVLRAAERRIAEMGGGQVERTGPLLVVQGEAIEKPIPRIVEAVGRGKRHPGW